MTESGHDLVRARDLEKILGTAKGQIHTWRSRKGANRFPEPIASMWKPNRRTTAPLWDLVVVEAWWADYNEKRQRARGAFTEDVARKAGKKSKPKARARAPRKVPQKAPRPLKYPVPVDLRSRLNRVNGRRP